MLFKVWNDKNSSIIYMHKSEIFLLISVFAITCTGLITTAAIENIDIITYAMISFGFAFAISIIYNLVSGNKITAPFLSIVSGICFCIAKISGMEGYKVAPNPGLIQAMAKYQIILLTIVSVVFFNSKIHFKEIIGFFIALIGGIIISLSKKNQHHEKHPYWYIYGLLSGLMITGNDILGIKLIRGGLKGTEITTPILGVTFIMTIIYKYLITKDYNISFKNNNVKHITIIQMLFGGLFSALNLLFLSEGLALSKNPGTAKTLTMLSIVLLTLSSVYFFNDTLDTLTWSGIILLMVGLKIVR